MIEIWKDINGFEGIYQVSNFGRIKSLGRKVVRRKMGVVTIKEAILNPHVDKVGYPRLYLYKKDFTKRNTVHRLVSEAFIPNPENKPSVNHKNCIRTDNRVENLEWCTQKENIIHAHLNNRREQIRGEQVVTAKLNNEKVLEIRKLMSEGVMRKTVAEKFNISAASVRLIVKRINWAHI